MYASCHTDYTSMNLPHTHAAGNAEQIKCFDKQLRQKYKLPLSETTFREKLEEACGNNKNSGREL